MVVRDYYSLHLFPFIFEAVISHQGFEAARRDLLKQARGEILEIGIGTGLNIPAYPPWVNKIAAIEPNVGMCSLIARNLGTRELKIDCKMARAEALPFPDKSFDTVVSTFTLCSLTDIRQALREIRRVLKPGGRFLFMEHGLSREPWVRFIQRILNPVQNIVGCGCKLTLDIERELTQAGFRFEELKISYVGTGPRFLGHLYSGKSF